MVTHKYRAKPVEIDGIRFASTAEGRRYSELKLLLAAGQISALELQPRYPLEVNRQKIGTYVGDFRYRTPDGTLVLEDVKGMLTPVYRLKRKLMKAIYDIEIAEVK